MPKSKLKKQKQNASIKKAGNKKAGRIESQQKKNKTKTVLQQTENKPKRHGEQNQEHGWHRGVNTGPEEKVTGNTEESRLKRKHRLKHTGAD